MNSWLAGTAVALVVLMLGLVGYQFSLRVLRVVTGFVAVAATAYITWYGSTYTKPPPSSLSGAFTAGSNALGVALFHLLPVPPGHDISGPGRVGWLIIAVVLVIGYRVLEAWTQHCHARLLDTSALADDRQNAQKGNSHGDGMAALTDKQLHDRLVAELKFWLPAMEVRSPAILPGGSRSGELASIAEASGVTGSGLAGAIIRFFGMLWPSPRRAQVRVWVEQPRGEANIDDVTRVTVHLEDPQAGVSIATKTLAANNLHHAASVVAGYVARHIFAEDRTVPPWCTGTADGHDLAAMLLARQVRICPGSQEDVHSARSTQIQILENVAYGNLCAGVVRYELAHLYDLTGRHVEALLLHAINRERYPRFYRGRYRLAMSLEMVSNPAPEKGIEAKTEAPALKEALKILYRCGVTKADKSEAVNVDDGKVELLARAPARSASYKGGSLPGLMADRVFGGH
jgi:hypothetical protein